MKKDIFKDMNWSLFDIKPTAHLDFGLFYNSRNITVMPFEVSCFNCLDSCYNGDQLT